MADEAGKLGGGAGAVLSVRPGRLNQVERSSPLSRTADNTRFEIKHAGKRRVEPSVRRRKTIGPQ
jgi:hypothetical protein